MFHLFTVAEHIPIKAAPHLINIRARDLSDAFLSDRKTRWACLHSCNKISSWHVAFLWQAEQRVHLNTKITREGETWGCECVYRNNFHSTTFLYPLYTQAASSESKELYSLLILQVGAMRGFFFPFFSNYFSTLAVLRWIHNRYLSHLNSSYTNQPPYNNHLPHIVWVLWGWIPRECQDLSFPSAWLNCNESLVASPVCCWAV